MPGSFTAWRFLTGKINTEHSGRGGGPAFEKQNASSSALDPKQASFQDLVITRSEQPGMEFVEESDFPVPLA